MSFIKKTEGGRPKEIDENSLIPIQLEKEENIYAYNSWKKKIQETILNTFSNQEWVFEYPKLTPFDLNRLKVRIEQRGFAIKLDESSSDSKMKVWLPIREQKEDNGYNSDGWDEKFKGSEIRKSIQKVNTQTFQELTKKIDFYLKTHPNYFFYRFYMESGTPEIVMKWMRDALNEKGFYVSIEFWSKLDQSGGRLNCYHFLLRRINAINSEEFSVKIS